VIEPPRIPLATLPTPLVRLKRLEAVLGGGPQIWMKRDDLTGLELSGNKVRKLEYIAAEMQAAGHDALITEGTCQSNHCRATAAVCAKLGFQARLLFRPIPTPPVQGNQLLDRLFGAETRAFTRENLSQHRESIIQAQIAELRATGRKPRYTPAGASEPLGCWGYINAARELEAQLLIHGIDKCDRFVAVSSGGTYAGLLLGTLLTGHSPFALVGVPVSDDLPYHVREIGRLCRDTIAQFQLPIAFRDDKMKFIDGYVGDGYAIPYAKANEAIRLLARTEGIVLDPVYTAKAFCALLDGIRDGRLRRERPVVFIHTGGIFSDFAWPEEVLGRESEGAQGK
jgi:D-cysteine desulfhydrase